MFGHKSDEKKDRQRRSLNESIIKTAKEVLPKAVQAIRHAEFQEGDAETTDKPRALRQDTAGMGKLDIAVHFLCEIVTIPGVPEFVEEWLLRTIVTVVVEVAKEVWPGPHWILQLENAFGQRPKAETGIDSIQ